MKRLVLILPALMTSCGTLPEPFYGDPGVEGAKLGAPPSPVLYVPLPGGAMLGDTADLYARDLAAALASDDVPTIAGQGGAQDWRLETTAQTEAGQVVPSYNIIGPGGKNYGTQAGTGMDAKIWASGRPDAIEAQAQADALLLSKKLAAINDVVQTNNPDSLKNRVPCVFFGSVSGAPGDGDSALALNMNRDLPSPATKIVTQPQNADFTVSGVVKTTQDADKKVLVEIDWIVHDSGQREVGQVTQLHELDTQDIQPSWGDVAAAAAREGAAGVNEVISNATLHKAPATAAPGEMSEADEGGALAIPPDFELPAPGEAALQFAEGAPVPAIPVPSGTLQPAPIMLASNQTPAPVRTAPAPVAPVVAAALPAKAPAPVLLAALPPAAPRPSAGVAAPVAPVAAVTLASLPVALPGVAPRVMTAQLTTNSRPVFAAARVMPEIQVSARIVPVRATALAAPAMIIAAAPMSPATRAVPPAMAARPVILQVSARIVPVSATPLAPQWTAPPAAPAASPIIAPAVFRPAAPMSPATRAVPPAMAARPVILQVSARIVPVSATPLAPQWTAPLAAPAASPIIAPAVFRPAAPAPSRRPEILAVAQISPVAETPLPPPVTPLVALSRKEALQPERVAAAELPAPVFAIAPAPPPQFVQTAMSRPAESLPIRLASAQTFLTPAETSFSAAKKPVIRAKKPVVKPFMQVASVSEDAPRIQAFVAVPIRPAPAQPVAPAFDNAPAPASPAQQAVAAGPAPMIETASDTLER